MTGYRDSREHLFEHLRRLDMVLNLHVVRQRRAASPSGFDEFRGLFISEEEIDEVLRQATGDAGSDEPAGDAQTNGRHAGERHAGERRAGERHGGAGRFDDDDETRSLSAAVEQMERSIALRSSIAPKDGNPLALSRLSRLFGLNAFDIDALLVCLAPELDLKYEKLYAYLQDDVTRKRPTVNLVLNLFCRSLDEKLAARARLTADAPLFAAQLLRYADEAHAEQMPFLSRPLKIDERVLQYLLGADAADEHLSSFVTLKRSSVRLSQVILREETKESLARIFHSRLSMPQRNGGAGSRIFVLEGAAGVGKCTLAEALCASADLELLVADVPRLMSLGANITPLLGRLLREALLRRAGVFFDRAESLLGEAERETHARSALLRALGEFPGVAFVGTEQPWHQHPDTQAEQFIRVALPLPDFPLRRRIWDAFLADEHLNVAGEVERDGVADKFAFTAGKIRAAINEARHSAVMRDGDGAQISNDDLYRACRSQSSQRLAGMARKIKPLYTWRDIVLPSNRIEHLREICAHVRHRQRVFGDWGFERKLALGRGLGVLFVGPSGTGKTMAAEIIAGELGLDLYKIDLSSVVSKYIGETEKNLSRIFQEAEQSNAVLFFDEADAIFGKRSEVKDSHDRYANIETNYLLQRMEEYEGMVILASNFQKNIDDAFTRRIRFVVDFPFPDDTYRQHIWRKVFPETTPLDADIDFDFLAQKLKLAGGNIKNIALNAAFLAARNGGRVHMEHLVCATKREFQKMGRLCVKADFDQYYEYVEREEEEVAL